MLQTVDLATGRGLDDAVAAQVLAEGVAEHAGIVAQLVRAALGSAAVQHAAARPHWRETYVGTVVGDRLLEGFIDLIYRDDGLVIIDYKTDTVPAVALDQRIAFYRPQMAAYATALQAATQEAVTRCILVFLSPGGPVERTVGGIKEAAALVRDAVRSGSTRERHPGDYRGWTASHQSVGRSRRPRGLGNRGNCGRRPTAPSARHVSPTGAVPQTASLC